MIRAEREARKANAHIEARRRELDQSLDAVKARCSSLHGFVAEAWSVLEPTTPFVDGWVIKAICDHLQAVTDGKITRLLINVPPGFAKSLIVAVFWPAWEWTKRPSLRYLSASYELGLAMRDNNRMRRLVKSEWYRRHWGDVVAITPDQDAKQKFENTASGGRECRAFISLTGGRGDRIIIDDPHSVKTAESEKVRLETIKIFLEAVPNRVNDPERSAIVVIMQRLHDGDVSGTILSKGLGYVHLMLPMEFEVERRCSTSIGFTDPRTFEGELLAPERMGRAAVETLKLSLMAYGAASQLQQRPSPREGNLFKVAMLQVVDVLPAGITKAVRAWDFAATRVEIGKDPDWTTGVKVFRDDERRLIVVDVLRMRDSSLQVKKAVKATASRDSTSCRIRIPQDPAQAGKAQADDYLRELMGYNVKAVRPTGDKVTRADPAAKQVEGGNVYLLRGPWNEAFVEELRTFPTGAHDDQVDAFADAINEIAEIAPNEGQFDFLREEAAKLTALEHGERRDVEGDEWWLLRPPTNILVAYGLDGTSYAKNADGVMRVHPDDAPAFLGQFGWSRIVARAEGTEPNG